MKWAPDEEEGHGSDICQMHCPAEFEYRGLQAVEGEISDPDGRRHRSIGRSISHAKTTFGLQSLFINVSSELYDDILVRVLQGCNCGVQDESNAAARDSESNLRWNRANEDWR
jgi:hypothetical protein